MHFLSYRPAYVAYGGQYLILTPTTDCLNNLVYFTDLSKWADGGRNPKPEFLPVIETFEAEFHVRKCVYSRYYLICAFAPLSRPSPIWFLVRYLRRLFSLLPHKQECTQVPAHHDWPQLSRIQLLECHCPRRWAKSSHRLSGSLRVSPQYFRPRLIKYLIAHDFWFLILLREYLIVHYRLRMNSSLQIRQLEDGTLIQDISLPTWGSVIEVQANRKYPDFYYCFQSFLTSEQIFSVDLRKQELKKVLRGEGSSLVQESYVPTMFSTHRKPQAVPVSVNPRQRKDSHQGSVRDRHLKCSW